MKLVLKNKDNCIKEGDILVFSDHCAYLIVRTDIEYLAVQILNNGNEELGFVNYTDFNLDILFDRLCKDNGNTPEYIKNMNDVTLEF